MPAVDHFYTLLSKVFGIDVLLVMEDTAYVLKRNEHPEEYRKHMEDFRERFRNGFIMGGSFGLALLFSLRRYFPGQFNTFSLNRAIVELTLLGGCLAGSTLSVVFGGSKLVHSIKKDYILGADPDYYQHMAEVSLKYRIPEQTQVRFVLSSQEFQQWRQVREAALKENRQQSREML